MRTEVLTGDDAAARAELEARVERYAPDRYPVQHASARYHLGCLDAAAGELADAHEHLMTAAQLFKPRLAREFGVTLVALGAVLRDLGQLRDASLTFARAVEIFEDEGATDDLAVALHDLGLVERERGEVEAAIEALERAVDLNDPARAPRRAAAARRELGSAYLLAGRPDEAHDVLDPALGLAERAGDLAGMGAAANVLGLALLARTRPDDAVEAFRTAVAGNPLTVRPEGYAMAKANLALAHRARGDGARARLAAAQAVAVDRADGQVRSQAARILADLGSADVERDLHTVLDDERPDGWAVSLRDEVARWLAGDDTGLRRSASRWVAGLAGRPGEAVDRTEALLGIALEIPPTALRRLVDALIVATESGHDPQTTRRWIDRAAVRFHAPQYLRLKDTFNHRAAERGDEEPWL